MDKVQLLRSKKLFLFDMDGTIYMGDRLFPFTRELLARLKETGRSYQFLTNNSSLSAEGYVEKLERLGIPARKEEIITSGQAASVFLGREYRGKPIYVCGTESFRAYLRQEGFRVTGKPEEARCVLMSLDTELTFGKLRDVCRILSEQPELPYFATHPDLICPAEFGFVPDCGSICQMVFHATGRMPEFIGKPSPLMPQLAMAAAGCSREETIVVGDRLSTDIASGFRAGVDTALVLTGEAGVPESQQAQVRPTVILQDAGEILNAIT